MSEIINKPDKFIAKWNTEKIQNIVKSAVEQMPEEATNIRLIEGYRQSIGIFGTCNCWTEVEAVYENDEGHEVGRVKTIDKIGGWQYNDPANYVLYHMGLYKPYSEDNLKSIKAIYETDVNNGSLLPINEIYTNQYLMDLKVKETIWSTTTVDLNLILDYNSHIWRSKDYRVKLGNFITEPLSEYDAYFLFVNTFDVLLENGIEVFTFFDMKSEDKEKLKHWRWREEINF